MSLDPRVSFLARLAAANVFLVIFNMIPAFPMDGGRVLHAVLAMKLGGASATQIAASIGQALAFALGFLGLFGNPLLIFIAIFVYMAAAGEARMSAFNEAARGLSVGEAMKTRFNAIPVEANLASAIETLLATAQHEFPVVDAFGKPVGLVVREDLLSALKDHGREASITTFMRAPVETVRRTAPLEAVLKPTSFFVACITMPKGPRGENRPRDTNQLAKLMVNILTGQVEDREPTPEERGVDPAASAMGRKAVPRARPA